MTHAQCFWSRGAYQRIFLRLIPKVIYHSHLVAIPFNYEMNGDRSDDLQRLRDQNIIPESSNCLLCCSYEYWVQSRTTHIAQERDLSKNMNLFILQSRLRLVAINSDLLLASLTSLDWDWRFYNYEHISDIVNGECGAIDGEESSSSWE